MSKNVIHLQHVKSSVVESGKPKLPTAGILAEGEIAVNYADGYETLSIKSSSGNIKTFSSDEYYTEQKLGSGFTSENSARTVTDVIEENELVISSALNDLNDRVIGLSASTDASISSINEVKLDVSAFTEHTASTVHMSETEKTNLDSLETNIETISGITQADVTSWNGKADANHTQASSTITSMTSYSVASSASSIETTDTLNEAIGKLEKRDEILEAIHENDATVQDVEDLTIPPSGDCETLEEYVESVLEGARLVNAELSGSVVSITNNSGETRSIDLLNATEENVQIVVTTEVTGVDVSGLTINVYYNGVTTPTTTITTDANGMASLRVPNGYTYKLVFPSIEGCSEIAPVVHTASVSQRSVEVEYKEYTQTEGEKVTVLVRDFANNSYTNVSGVTITVTYDNISNQYITNSYGKVSFNVPYGKSYSVTTQQRENKHIRYNEYTQTQTAEYDSRTLYFTYYDYEVGIFVVIENGSQYPLDDWKELVEGGIKQNSEALYIKVATSDLCKNNGVFVLDIDMIRERTYGSAVQWCNENVLFKSIPENGNSAYQPYYFDGLNASLLIHDEGVDRTLHTPAVDKCLAMSRTIGGRTSQGFLGSVGQWYAAWVNVSSIDEILTYTRPNGTYLLSTLTTNKWTSTQYSAAYSWYWTTAPGSSYKTNSCAVVPFFAF